MAGTRVELGDNINDMIKKLGTEPTPENIQAIIKRLNEEIDHCNEEIKKHNTHAANAQKHLPTETETVILVDIPKIPDYDATQKTPTIKTLNEKLTEITHAKADLEKESSRLTAALKEANEKLEQRERQALADEYTKTLQAAQEALTKNPDEKIDSNGVDIILAKLDYDEKRKALEDRVEALNKLKNITDTTDAGNEARKDLEKLIQASGPTNKLIENLTQARVELDNAIKQEETRKRIVDSTNEIERKVRSFLEELNKLDSKIKDEVLGTNQKNPFTLHGQIRIYNDNVSKKLFGGEAFGPPGYLGYPDEKPIDKPTLQQIITAERETNTAIQALSDALAAAQTKLRKIQSKTAGTLAEAIKRLAENIDDKLGEVGANYKKSYPEMKTYAQEHEALRDKISTFRDAYQALSKLKSELITPANDAELKKIEAEINNKIAELNEAFDEIKIPYKIAEKKIALKNKIQDAYHRDPTVQQLVRKLRAEYQDRNERHTKFPEIIRGRDKIEQILSKLNHANDDKALKALEDEFNEAIKEFNDALQAARPIIFADKGEDIHKKFSHYQEYIRRIETYVQLVTSKSHEKDQFEGRENEVKELQQDMQLYLEWCNKHGKEKAATRAKECLKQLDDILVALRKPSEGLVHFAEYSTFFEVNVTGKTEEEIDKAVKEKENQFLKDKGINQANLKPSTAALCSAPDTGDNSRITKDFYGVRRDDTKNTVIGRINIHQIKVADQTLNFVVNQRLRNGATVSTLTLPPGYSEQRRQLSFSTGMPALIPQKSDRQLAMEMVLNHVVADIYRQLHDKLGTDPDAAKKADAILAQLMKGEKPAALTALHITPSTVYINGNWTENQARAVAHACHYLGLEWRDTRNASKHKIIEKLDTTRVVSYKKEIDAHPEVYFRNSTKPFFARPSVDTKELVNEIENIRPKP